MHSTNQLADTIKKDKVNQVLALINELQVQDTISSDDEQDILAIFKDSNGTYLSALINKTICDVSQFQNVMVSTKSLEYIQTVL